jgi:hypothetical protein
MDIKRLLCTLSGDDFSIIKSCRKDLQSRFMAIGLFVLAIFSLCFVGSYVTFTRLFQNYVIGIPIAVFFSWMITNIYLLLLYTLSKNSFPSVSNKGARTFSLSIRILFICFIAIVVSKPVETLIYSNQLRKEIEQFRQKQITLYTTSTTEYFDSETANMRSIIDRQQNLGMDNSATQIQVYEELINKKEEQKQKLIRSMTLLVNRSNYYIESIKILNVSYPSCWIITLVIILIFLIPAYIKNLLGENSAFYEIKGKIERRIVIEEYDIFKGKYSSIFQDNFQMDKSFVEIYIDPPFNTIRKKDERTFLKESDLLTDLYNV